MSKFPKSVRLLSASDFSQVFDSPKKIGSQALLILYKENSKGLSRIGFALSKRRLARASERNKVKRVIRESFRAQQKDLPNVDIVVIARQGLKKLDRAKLREHIDTLWTKF